MSLLIKMLSQISFLCLFTVELITEPLKTHKSSLQMTIKNFGIALHTSKV